jgi:hypothetical protein
MGSHSSTSRTFVVRHPVFGEVTFVFDSRDAASGFASTDGFIYLGAEYPKLEFGFQREGRVFTESRLNDLTSKLVDGVRRTIAEVTPPAFRSFVLSKAKELSP